MDAFSVIALLLAAICFTLGAVGVAARVAWVPLGLLAWVSVSLIYAIRAL